MTFDFGTYRGTEKFMKEKKTILTVKSEMIVC